MGNVKFAGIPEMNTFDVPFQWEQQALGDWLHSLPASEPEKSCQQICRVLQALNQAGLNKNSQRLLLEEISAYVTIFEKRVETDYLDSPVPLAGHQLQSVEVLVWSFLSLAKNYQFLADRSVNSMTKAEMLFRALLALSHAYRHMCAVYSEPCDGFWQMCYQIYSIAEADDLLNIKIEQDGQHSSSIINLFKLVLVFSLCSYQQFRPGELKWIFSYLRTNAHQLLIAKQFKSAPLKGLFAIQLDNDKRPLNLSREPLTQQDSSTLFIAPAMFAKKIYETLHDTQNKLGGIKKINQDVLMKVVKTLGLSQTRKFNRIEGQGTVRGLVGFAHVRDYLSQFMSDELKHQNPVKESIPVKPYDYDTSKYELILKGDEDSHNTTSKLYKKPLKDESINKIFAVSDGLSSKIKVWNSEERLPASFDADIIDFAVSDSSAKGYGIDISKSPVKASVGDLFAVISDQDQRVELALIRWLRRFSEEQFDLGIELIGVAKGLVLMKGSGSQQKQTWAIFLPEIAPLHQADTLVYFSGDFNVGEIVTIHKDNREMLCRLDKPVNSTSSVSQVELVYL